MNLGILDVPDWLIGLIAILVVLYIAATWNFDFFEKKNIPYLKPFPLFGSIVAVTFQRRSFADEIIVLYNKLKGHKYAGVFTFQVPITMIRDPELIKQVTIKDFDHFTDHRRTVNEDVDPLFGKNLFAMRGKQWRAMRTTLSPAFTSSKMKGIFNLISEIGNQVGEYMEKQALKNKGGSDEMITLEMKEFFTRFATDVIATSAFGLKVDSLHDPNNEFFQMGKDLTNMTGWKGFVLFLLVFAPKLTEFLRIPFINKQNKDFFHNLVHDTIKTREKQGIVRPDMIQLLMQAKKNELNASPEEQEDNDHHEKTVLTDEEVTAQAVIFFFAGFETISTALCFTSYLVTVNPDVQEKLLKEIDSVLKEDGKLTYDGVQKMKYLDMVISESLRLYPPVAATDRTCTQDYVLPDGQILRKGDLIWLPVYGLHMDPQYFPDPKKFNPERFSDENKGNIVPFTYFPFGLGPRLCIGQRFALLEAKIAFVSILSKFTMHAVPKTPVPLKLSAKGFNMTVDGGFWLGLKPRKTKTANGHIAA